MEHAMANKILSLIKEKENEYPDLYARMDRDRDVVRLGEYALTGFAR